MLAWRYSFSFLLLENKNRISRSPCPLDTFTYLLFYYIIIADTSKPVSWKEQYVTKLLELEELRWENPWSDCIITIELFVVEIILKHIAGFPFPTYY